MPPLIQPLWHRSELHLSAQDYDAGRTSNIQEKNRPNSRSESWFRCLATEID